MISRTLFFVAAEKKINWVSSHFNVATFALC